MARIKTTGELRSFLADMLLGIKNGHVDDDTARSMTKMAAQINESFYSEIKIAKTQKEMGRHVDELGCLSISGAQEGE
jgi:hypothetical protein